MNRAISHPSAIQPNLNKFNYHSRPATNIQELLSSTFKIKSLQISPHGKTGVIFIQTNLGAFVLKSNNEGPSDQFLNRMAAILHINVPQTICFCFSDVIFHKLSFEIEKFCEKDEVLYARMRSRLDYPFYQILQYIPSISLAEVGRDRFQKYMLGDSLFIQIGMCIGFDLLTNNSDRFKLIWASDGNINNLLIEVKDHDSHNLDEVKDRSNTKIQLQNYVFIDHSGYLLDLNNQMAAKNFQKYMEKVCSFLTDMIRFLGDLQSVPKEYNKLKEQVQLFTHYPLTQANLKTISKGIIFSVNKFLESFENKSLEKLYDSMLKGKVQSKKRKDQQNNYWTQYWNEALGKINFQFLLEVFNKIAAIFTTYPEVIDQVVEDMDNKVTPKNTQFTEMENLSTQQPPKLEESENNEPEQKLSSVGGESRVSEPKEEQNPYKGSSSRGAKSALSNKALFNELKAPKWKQKIIKFKSANANHKEQQP